MNLNVKNNNNQKILQVRDVTAIAYKKPSITPKRSKPMITANRFKRKEHRLDKLCLQSGEEHCAVDKQMRTIERELFYPVHEKEDMLMTWWHRIQMGASNQESDVFGPQLLHIKRLNESQWALCMAASTIRDSDRLPYRVLERIREGFMLLLHDTLYPCPQGLSESTGRWVCSLSDKILDISSEQKLNTYTQHCFANMLGQLPPGVNVIALVQAVLRESYLLQNEIIYSYAQKIRKYNDRKRRIRDQLSRARKLSSTLDEGDVLPDDFEFTWAETLEQSDSDSYLDDQENHPEETSTVLDVPAHVTEKCTTPVNEYRTGLSAIVDMPPERSQPNNTTPGLLAQTIKDETSIKLEFEKGFSEISSAMTYHEEQMEAYIHTLEERLQSVGDIDRLAQIDLQNALQKQQQQMQMLSSISKVLHDTAMGVIQKIAG